jgi:hypothetical protein
VVGLLLCEHLVVEKHTDNVSLINCFTKRNVEGFPSPAQRFAAVAFLTDGLGDVALDLAIERLDTLEEVFRQTMEVNFPNPLIEVRFLFRVTQCVFPVAGPYQAILRAKGETLAQHRFVVA